MNEGSFSLQPFQHLLLLLLLRTAILTGVRWDLIAVLIHVSLITSKTGIIFTYLLAICMSIKSETINHIEENIGTKLIDIGLRENL